MTLDAQMGHPPALAGHVMMIAIRVIGRLSNAADEGEDAMKKLLACGASVLALGLIATLTMAQAPKIGDPPEVSNMRLVGYNDLQARSAYQPTLIHQGNRYLAYVGHHGGAGDVPKPINPMTREAEFNGTSIIDVTDPANPKYLKHIPGAQGGSEAGGAQMVRVCPGPNLPRAVRNKFYMLRTFG